MYFYDNARASYLIHAQICELCRRKKKFGNRAWLPCSTERFPGCSFYHSSVRIKLPKCVLILRQQTLPPKRYANCVKFGSLIRKK